MGYCPFRPWVVTHEWCHDRLGLVCASRRTGQVYGRACTRDTAAACDKVLVCARHGPNSSMSRTGLENWCCNTLLGVTTWLAVWVSRHGP